MDLRRSPDRPLSARSVAPLLALLLLASLALEVWYASRALHPGRYWDERYSLANVEALLSGGSFRPAHGYYQTLSYLPQAAVLAASRSLHRRTGVERFAVFGPDGSFTPTAYLLCRLLQTLYGAGCLLMTFVVGRRLFSPAIGLLAAFFLAVTPWSVQASSIFKPDVLLMLTVLVAFWWSLRAAERPTLRRHALAGCGVALAVSAKLNGALAGVPLLVAVAGSEGGWRRRGLRLLGAAGAGAGLFLALNPYFPMYTAFFTRNLERYTEAAAKYGGTRAEVLWREIGFLTGETVHGPVVGGLALAAAVVFGWRLCRRAWRAEAGARAGDTRGWMLLSLPVAYSLVYAALTPHFKGNNFLPLLPFTSLFAAWGLGEAWRRVADRLPALHRPRWRTPAAALLVVALAPTPCLFAYREAVPSTEELARAFLLRRFREHGPTEGRRIYSESWPSEIPESSVPPSFDALERSGVVVIPVESLPALPRPELRAADGEIFSLERLLERDDDFYWHRSIGVSKTDVRRFEPALFAARGPGRLAIARVGTSAPSRREPRTGPRDHPSSSTRSGAS